MQRGQEEVLFSFSNQLKTCLVLGKNLSATERGTEQ